MCGEARFEDGERGVFGGVIVLGDDIGAAFGRDFKNAAIALKGNGARCTGGLLGGSAKIS